MKREKHYRSLLELLSTLTVLNIKCTDCTLGLEAETSGNVSTKYNSDWALNPRVSWDGFSFILYLISLIISSLEHALQDSNELEICGFAPQFGHMQASAMGHMQVFQDGPT